MPAKDAEGEMLRSMRRKAWTPKQQQAELYRHRCAQNAIRRKAYAPHNKALGGPREHEEFHAWDDDHPLCKLFHVPNAWYTGLDLMAYSELFWCMSGTVYWWVMRNEYSVPVELWVVPTHWVRIVTGPNGVPEAWAVQSPWGNLQFVPFDDFLIFYDHSPLSLYEGWGVTLMIAEWIDAYESNVRARLAQYKNGAIPAFQVALSEEYVDPDEAMLARYYSKWLARFQGEDNTGRPLITGPGVEIKQLGIAPVNMGYVEMDNQMRDNILAAYKVPKGILGLEPVSDVSAYAPQRAFSRFCINPQLGMYGSRVTHGLVRRTPHLDHGVMFWNDRVVDDPETNRQEISTRAANRAISPNQVLSMFGQEPWPFGGDDPINPTDGSELGWATGKKPAEQEEAEGAAQQAEQRRLEINEDDSDSPLIIDKDEDEPSTTLRWHRTPDGHLEAHGRHRWFIERIKDDDGKLSYALRLDGEPHDRASAIGLLKELAERREAQEQESIPAEPKALGGGNGSSGGYLQSTQTFGSPVPVEPRNGGESSNRMPPPDKYAWLLERQSRGVDGKERDELVREMRDDRRTRKSYFFGNGRH